MKRTILLLLFVPFLLLNCDKKSTDPGSENNPPVIETITFTPDYVTTESVVSFVAVASDEDGDELTYEWSSQHGYFPYGTTGFTVQWMPETDGSHSVKLKVSDDEDTVSKIFIIYVN